MKFRVVKPETEWRAQLSPEQYAVCRQKATERPFTGRYNEHAAAGTYRCVCCGQPLFASRTKFNAGCGWPSFSLPVDGEAIAEASDRSHGMVRTEVMCSNCGAHLGHVFDDGPGPDGLRYCINSVSLKLVPR